MASVDLDKQPGVVLDYNAVNSGTDCTFASGQTYYVSGGVNFSGTVTFEGDTIIKFAPDSSAQVVIDGGNIVCQTTPGYSAIFTARDDDTVGETVTGSTGTPANYYNGEQIWEGGGFAYGNGLVIVAYNQASYKLSNLKFLKKGWRMVFFKRSF